jgi:hypothetical protein
MTITLSRRAALLGALVLAASAAEALAAGAPAPPGSAEAQSVVGRRHLLLRRPGPKGKG